MRLVLVMLIWFVMGCAPSTRVVVVDAQVAGNPADANQTADAPAKSGSEVFIQLGLPVSKAEALRKGAPLPVDAEFTITGVEEGGQLPAGVVHIVALTPDGKSTPVGLVSLRAPFDSDLSRAVRIDLSSGVSGADLAKAAEIGTLKLGFVVEAKNATTSIGIKNVSARVSSE